MSEIRINPIPDYLKKQESPDPDNVESIDQMRLRQDLSAWANTVYEKCKNDMSGIRNQWYINLAFYKGDQYVQMLNGKLIKTPPMTNRVRSVINRIRPAVRTEISRMTSQRPTATVLPASAEDDDYMAAEAGESVWEFVSETKEIQSYLIDAAFWIANCGIGYIKTEWDASVDTGEVQQGPLDPTTGMPITVPIMGDIVYSSPSPFHIFVPDALERDIEKQAFVIHIFTLTVAEAKAKWGAMLPEDFAPSISATNDIMETSYLNLQGTQNEGKPDSVLMKEIWVKPGATALLPKGGMIITVDKTVVYMSTEGLPHDHKEYPFAKFDNVLSGGYYSTSPIEDLIPLQKELNRNRSLGVETRNLAGKPMYVAQEGSVDVNKWVAKPGGVILYKPGFTPPQALQSPQLPAYVGQEHEMLLRDIEDISGQHQVSKGSAPTGVTAATAISFLQEQDESYMSTVYYFIEKGMQKIARQTLKLCVQYWDQPRMIRAVGTDQGTSAKLLSRADIQGGTDIRMDTGSAMPVSKSARNAMIMDMMNRGQLPPDKGLEMMDLPNMRTYYNLIKVDEKHATRENLKLRDIPLEDIQEAAQIAEEQKAQFLMQNGMDEEMARQRPDTAQILDQFNAAMLPVNDWDNDEVHIEIHQRFMKSQAFEMLDDALRDQFIKHVQAHKDKMQMAQLTSMMSGGTSGGPIPGMEGMGPEGMPPAEGGVPEGGQPNQFAGIEEPVDGNLV